MQLTALALWLNTAFAGFDEAVATAIHQLYVAAGWFFTPFLSFISLLGKGGIFLILLSIALMLFRKRGDTAQRCCSRLPSALW